MSQFRRFSVTKHQAESILIALHYSLPEFERIQERYPSDLNWIQKVLTIKQIIQDLETYNWSKN